MRAPAPLVTCLVARLVATVLAAVVAACSDSPTAPSGPGSGRFFAPLAMPSLQTAVLVGAGDIGECGSPGPALTAALIDAIPGIVFLAGDLAYPHGSEADFSQCFDPTWGRFRSRWRPSPGNHEYETPGAEAYFRYFGDAAGPGRLGYYAFSAGNWLVLMLNSNVSMARSSPQHQFISQTLDNDDRPCTLAIWHHPLFSSGPNGDNPVVRDVWRELYDERADVIVNGHDHLYERFGLQDPDGRPDLALGIRQFTSGAGGARLSDVVRASLNSEARIKAYGVLKLTLEPTAYRWEFIEAGGAVGDQGVGLCH